MKKVSIRFNEDLLDAMDRFIASEKLQHAAIIGETLRHWLKERED